MSNKPKNPDFGATGRLQREYEAGMRKIIKRVLPPRRPEQTLAQWTAELAERSRRPDILAASERLAERMVKWADVGNRRTWREAAARSQRSRKLYAMAQAELAGRTGVRYRQLVKDNAALISSLPLHAAETLNGEIARATENGARPATIAKMMRRRFPELLRSRVHLISRTETQKASTALTRARSEDVGADWYVWESSDDVRTRRSHKKMHGVLVPWAEAPDPEALIGEKSTLGHYQAGECPNCRCTTIVMLSADDVTWPRRVYWQGAVRQMNKQQFLKLIGAAQE